MFAKGFNKVLLNRVVKVKQSDNYESHAQTMEDKVFPITKCKYDVTEGNKNNTDTSSLENSNAEEQIMNKAFNYGKEILSEDMPNQFYDIQQIVTNESVSSTPTGYLSEKFNFPKEETISDDTTVNVENKEGIVAENDIDTKNNIKMPLSTNEECSVDKGPVQIQEGTKLHTSEQCSLENMSTASAVEALQEKMSFPQIPSINVGKTNLVLPMDATNVDKTDKVQVDPSQTEVLKTPAAEEGAPLKNSETTLITNENSATPECDEIVVSNSPILPDFEELADEEKECIMKEKVDSPPQPPPPDTTFRKLARPLSQDPIAEEQKRKKRHWGKKESKEIEQEATISTDIVSGELLKDIVPDVKPYLEDLSKDDELDHEQETEEEEINGEEQEKPKPADCDELLRKTVDPDAERSPSHQSAEDTSAENQPIVKPRKGSISNLNPERECVIEIRNLVRPFTLIQLKELLLRTGKIKNIENGGFWIDRIKSHAIVEYLSADEADETAMALDGVKWPNTNPKKLSVTFSNKKILEKAINDNEAPVNIRNSREYYRTSSNREVEDDISRKRKHSEGQNDSSNGNYYDSSSQSKRVKSSNEKDIKVEGDRSNSPKPKKHLDDLFRKTKALPCIYWLPKQQKLTKS